mmetsp:Transcript_80702/g.193570  ORF Transcript_80702/g.193570 Transcript_80702/m.193570 type:complete len:612 (+) Transcript_80702:44-1879(+)|eukprot:CAMPEP_0181427352 /NCGR_PEP_ID=MMETSP1110-20121109/16126_1 /TAXON_ID=174948 /ORGANISM="Symbiodinium sp., Strain CCMP421" /LENGTH=611 /DNA_ID=CAMNT_0023550559 /DNA_START=41 /DNA_END=1876 /DNA_ORIENTATION=+
MAFLMAMFLTLPALHAAVDGDARCLCKNNHTEKDIEKHGLIYESNQTGETRDYSTFGIGCKSHKRDAEFAQRIYKHWSAEQLHCSEEGNGPSGTNDPWCSANWCYIENARNCSLDWQHGHLGPVSYATCGNVHDGWPDYLVRSMAPRLQGDPLRVLHLESSLDKDYMGNSQCDDSNGVHCEGLFFRFWKASLSVLEQLNVSVISTLIKKHESIDDYFDNIRRAFDQRVESWENLTGFREKKWTNYDICAFATALGWVDLCSGQFALNRERQELTFMVELHTTPAFIISQSSCHFAEFWWWIKVFRADTWWFILGTFFILILSITALNGKFAALATPGDLTAEARASLARNLCLVCEGLFEAFVEGSTEKTDHDSQDEDGKLWLSCARKVAVMGLKVFILVTTTIYCATLTTDLVVERQRQGKFPTLEAVKASTDNVTICLHEVYRTSMLPHERAHINTSYYWSWEELMGNYTNRVCDAAIIDEEAWTSFRAHRRLCDSYKPDMPTFYMSTGVTVSRRAYRTLEAFRYNTTAAAFELDSPDNHALRDEFLDGCPPNSPAQLCETKEVPWEPFQSVALVGMVPVVVGILVVGVKRGKEARARPRFQNEAEVEV